MNKNILPLLFILLFTACSPSFKKGYKHYTRQAMPAAQVVFERYREHPRYAPAAQFYLAKIQKSDTRDLPGLLDLDRYLANADSLYRHLPPKHAGQLAHKFSVDTLAIFHFREETQRWAVAGTRASGTLPALDSLLDGLPSPLPLVRPDVEATRTDIVNAHLHTADYDTMTAILRQHLQYVLPENYDQTRRMNEQRWTAFLEKYTPCALDRFAREHPNTFVGRDCWREDVRRLLCTGDLPTMLDFHASNRWTALEIVLLNAIADHAADSATVAALSPEHQQHLQHLQHRILLRGGFHSGAAARDTAAAFELALAYIAGYAPRYSAFRLMEEGLQFFLDGRYYASAIALLERARPFFPDTLPPGCPTNFDYQLRARPWIDGKLPILRRPDRPVSKRPLTALNTPGGEEFSPVVRADGREILFAAKNRPDNLAGTDVFAAHWDADKQDWSPPVLVPVLAGRGHFVPLSLTADGLLLLLTVNNRLHTSRRTDTSAPWSTPAPLPVAGIAIMGKGCLSPDGYTLVLEGAYSTGNATMSPDLDLFVSHRDPATGAWSRPAALGADINTDGQETAPFLMPDGRTLYYVSTGYPGLGQGDVFVSRRTHDGWTRWTYPENMGKERNDIFPHQGYTTVAPDGSRAWMSADGDLWEVGF